MEPLIAKIGEYGVMGVILGIVLWSYIRQNQMIVHVIERNSVALNSLTETMRRRRCLYDIDMDAAAAKARRDDGGRPNADD